MDSRKKGAERPVFNGSARVVFSSDNSTRLAATSGGFVTALGRFLLKSGRAKSAITYEFAGQDLFFPKIVRDHKEYLPVGSVYHDTENVAFVRKNIERIESPVFITCLPCEVRALRAIFAKRNIESVIVSLVCSNQLTKEATYHFLSSMRIDRSQMTGLRYRGNGWPSGLQIQSGGRGYYFSNNGDLWMGVFHSHIFTLDRCYGCADTFGIHADFVVADPWLERYVKSDSQGATIVIPLTEVSRDYFKLLEKESLIQVIEPLEDTDVWLSQAFTLEKKAFFRRNRKLVRLVRSAISNRFYRAAVRSPFLLVWHTKVINKLIRIMMKVL